MLRLSTLAIPLSFHKYNLGVVPVFQCGQNYGSLSVKMKAKNHSLLGFSLTKKPSILARLLTYIVQCGCDAFAREDKCCPRRFYYTIRTLFGKAREEHMLPQGATDIRARIGVIICVDKRTRVGHHTRGLMRHWGK
jgi:hypothetical protein